MSQGNVRVYGQAERVDALIRQGVKRGDMPLLGIKVKYYDWRRRCMKRESDGSMHLIRSQKIKQTPLDDLKVFRAAASKITGLEGEELTAHLRTIRPCHAVTMFDL